MVVCYLPYMLGAGGGGLGFLPKYAQEEGLESGARYYLLDSINYVLDWCGVTHELPPRVFSAIAMAALAAIAVWAVYREIPLGKEIGKTQNGWIFSAFVLAITFSVLLSPFYPWYYAWLVLFLRSEEHTSELQSHLNLVCRLLLEKKKNKYILLTQDFALLIPLILTQHYNHQYD